MLKLTLPDFGELNFADRQKRMSLTLLIFTPFRPYISRIEALTLGYSSTKLELIISNDMVSTANNSKVVQMDMKMPFRLQSDMIIGHFQLISYSNSLIRLY